MGNLIHTIASDGSCICVAADTTDIVAAAEQYHKTSAVVTAALGRLLTAASIMGSQMKNQQDSVTLRLAGGGPAGTLIAVSDSQGNPRGYVENPIVELPLNPQGKLDVAGAVGKNGTLSVIRDVGGKEPASGYVPLVSGEIAEDITSYFAVSEQIPTVCALGVLVNPDLTVRAAGGYLIQLLPGAGEGTIDRIERNLQGVLPVSTMVDQGMTPMEIAQTVLAGFDPQVLEERRISYRCNCSRQRVQRALLSLGRQELESLLEKEREVQVECHFCDKKYLFSASELRALLEHVEQNGEGAV